MSNDILNASDDEDSQSDSKMNKTLLNSMHRRRMSCTLSVQQLWDAVKVSRYQRQIASNERIIKYMSRVHNISHDEVNRQVGYCLRDGLLLVQKKKTNKGSKQGVEQEGYKLPEHSERDKHDWYCFECHRGGDVIFCSGCHRVYHLSCINNLPNSRAKYLCPVCSTCDKPEVLDIRIKRLNRLVTLTCNMLKDRYGCLYSATEMLRRPITIGTIGAQLDIGDEAWRVNFLIHRVMDISKMISKAKDRLYSHLGQFIADARTIVHNVVIFHGVHSRMADDARRMLRDCQTEVTEIRTCHQCYHSYRSKTSKHWFCRPCIPPHNLVYAKTSPTSSYCPAKVLVVDGSKYEVRFFGGNHERAKVEIANCLPITANTSHFEVIRTPSWTKACEELKRHQDLLDKGPPSDSSSSSDDDDDSLKRVKRLKTLSAPSDIKTDADDSLGADEESSTQLSKQTSEEAIKEEDWDEDDEPLDSRLRGARSSQSSTTTSSSASASPSKRKRGRPPKPKTPTDSTPTLAPRPRTQPKPRSTATPTPAASAPKKRGRPRGSLNKKTLEELKAKSELKEEITKPEKPDEAEEEEDEEVKEEEEEPVDNVVEEQEEQAPEEKKPELLKPESPTSSSKSFDPKKNEEEIVSSSCTEPQFRSVAVQTKHNGSTIQKLEDELEELKTSHADQIKQLQAVHLQEITLTKKKQWCYNCEQEAIYHCCWNTAYCSTECQQVHWQREHKRVCRRKR